MEKDFVYAMNRIEKLNRYNELTAALTPLLEDASFRQIGLVDLIGQSDDDTYINLISELSSGHKIVLKIITELVAYMDGANPTLVLIDEPETHLHPPLVASLLRSIRDCLDRLNGFAIIATHSPVVLQELPGRYVRVIRRFGDRTRVEPPHLETFGESIGRITEHVFNLDDSVTDWHATLTELANEKTLAEVDELFENALGFSARSYVASAQFHLVED